MNVTSHLKSVEKKLVWNLGIFQFLSEKLTEIRM